MAKVLGHARELVAIRSKFFKDSGLDLDFDSEEQILEALEGEPWMLKRPLLYDDKRALAGFRDKDYLEFFQT